MDHWAHVVFSNVPLLSQFSFTPVPNYTARRVRWPRHKGGNNLPSVTPQQCNCAAGNTCLAWMIQYNIDWRRPAIIAISWFLGMYTVQRTRTRLAERIISAAAAPELSFSAATEWQYQSACLGLCALYLRNRLQMRNIFFQNTAVTSSPVSN